MAEVDSSGSWMTGTVFLGCFLVFLFIIIIVVAYNFNSQVKVLSSTQETKIDEMKKFTVDSTALLRAENQRLTAQVAELKANQDVMMKTYKKRYMASERRFNEMEDRFVDIDDLIESYTGAETTDKSENKKVASRDSRSNAKQVRVKVPPTRAGLRARQRGAPQRRATFNIPSDEEDDDMSDSEIAAADIRRQSGDKTLLDL